jgi:tetratricopeptide (TPR) repeat protein
MAYDVYQPCPCGSGKKLKFCCQAIAGDMDRITKLQENGQHRMAIQALESLGRSHPGNAWILTAQTATLVDQGEVEAARESARQLIESHPEHTTGLILYALMSLSTEGYEASKAAIQRAMERAHADATGMAAALALTIADTMQGAGNVMGARQHLALAMQLVAHQSQQEQQEVFMRLLEFDGNTQILYPLRSVHELQDFSSGQPEIDRLASQAMERANCGCWCDAAMLFTQAAEQQGDSAVLWQNAGLCRAWDADNLGASEALHEAAGLEADFEAAVECETIAQILDLDLSEDRVNLVAVRIPVKSLSRLITALDRHDRFARMPISRDKDPDNPTVPDALFKVLDRPVPTDQKPEDWTIDSACQVIAEVLLYDRESRDGDTDTSSPLAVVIGVEDVPQTDALDIFREAAGEEIEPPPGDAADQDERIVAGTVPREEHFLKWEFYLPPGTPMVVYQRLEREKSEQVLGEVWPATPLATLDGKTPLEAAQIPELKLQRTAALSVLDAQSDRRGFVLDLQSMRQRLGVEEPQTIEVRASTSFSRFSVMALHRLPIKQLSDSQLSQVMNRALLIRHGRFLYDVLVEVLSRPTCVKHVELDRVYRTLVDLCQQRFERDEALSWAARGRDYAQTQPKAFEKTLQWDLLSLSIRLHDPSDPNLQTLLQHIWSNYVPKLPDLRNHLMRLLEAYGLPLPAQAPDGTSGSTSEGGIWTPEPAAETEGGEKKLWLPGQ